MTQPRSRLPQDTVEVTRDRQRRIVRLSKVGMAHIARRHPELDGCEMAIRTAVENASFRCRGKTADREVLYAPNLGPAAWLAVVVAYGERGGEVITAFASKRGPKETQLI